MELGLKRRAAAEGVNLVLLARGKDQLEKTADEIVKESGVQALPITAIWPKPNHSNPRQPGKDRFGAIHIMVNNAAMHQATNYLANDLAGERITVNAVVPRLVGTEGREIWAENTAKQQNKTEVEFLEEFCRRMGIIAGRWAKMEEVASIVVLLASDRGQYINGSQLVIDGGTNANHRPA